MIDHKHIGRELSRVSIEVEKYPIRFFAEAIGEADPIHSDEAAAIREGYRSLVAPPTYVSCLWSLAMPGGVAVLEDMNVPMERVLHGEQAYEYGAPVCAGDRLEFVTRVTDIYDKKGGALEFVVLEVATTNQRGEQAALFKTVVVIRNA
jgi:acyl dehydratase